MPSERAAGPRLTSKARTLTRPANESYQTTVKGVDGSGVSCRSSDGQRGIAGSSWSALVLRPGYAVSASWRGEEDALTRLLARLSPQCVLPDCVEILLPASVGPRSLRKASKPLSRPSHAGLKTTALKSQASQKPDAHATEVFNRCYSWFASALASANELAERCKQRSPSALPADVFQYVNSELAGEGQRSQNEVSVRGCFLSGFHACSAPCSSARRGARPRDGAACEAPTSLPPNDVRGLAAGSVIL